MIVVRKLELKDLEQMILLRIAIQNYYLKYGDKSVITEAELIIKTRKYIKNHLNKNLFMFGLFIEDELVANCGFYFDEHFPTYSNPSGICGYICNVFTKEKYRGNGYQRLVFKACLEYAKGLGINDFKLNTRNEKAIDLYKSFGFEKANNIYTYKIEGR